MPLTSLAGSPVGKLRIHKPSCCMNAILPSVSSASPAVSVDPKAALPAANKNDLRTIFPCCVEIEGSSQGTGQPLPVESPPFCRTNKMRDEPLSEWTDIS